MEYFQCYLIMFIIKINVKFLSVKQNIISICTTAGSVFGHKDSPATVVGGLPNANHHDPWNRLHAGPAAFPAGPSWAKAPDKRDERDRGKDGERREIPHIKDEKDRYGNSAYTCEPCLITVSAVACETHPMVQRWSVK